MEHLIMTGLLDALVVVAQFFNRFQSSAKFRSVNKVQ